VLGVPVAYFYTEENSLADLIILFGKLKTSERKALNEYAESFDNRQK
jgi:hypothetical protein